MLLSRQNLHNEPEEKANMLIRVRVCESQVTVHALRVGYEVSNMILQCLGGLEQPLA